MKQFSGKITLTNNYHNSSVNLIVKDGRLSVHQVRRSHERLCGSSRCQCSDETGQRGRQQIMVMPTINNLTGAINGADVFEAE